jgi:hypothetical protein
VDEVKITKSGLFHTSKTETPSQILSGLARQCPALPKRAKKLTESPSRTMSGF